MTVIQTVALAASRFYSWHQRRLHLWLLLTLATLALLLSLSHWRPDWLAAEGLAPMTLLAVFGAALLCEYLDSSLGMGYGTTLTPILLIAGFEPMAIVPAVLLSELVTGVAAGLLHQRDGNIDLPNDARARRTLGLLAALSSIGALAAVILAVRLPGQWFGYAIVAIVVAMGVVTLLTARRRFRYRASGILAIGLIASFNKGLSGGGYGPLVTSGQVVSGMPARQAVVITSLAEAFTCLIGLIGYVTIKGLPDPALTLPLAAGALLSVPWATVTVRHLPENVIRAAVGVLTLVLGLVSLAKLLG
jgi:uncharacterized membrane protein YfcA